jgi:uncharacterized protein (DUF1800 family)
MSGVSDLAFARHAIERLGYGPAPGDLERIAAMGPDRWIAEQLEPNATALPASLQQRLGAFQTLRMTPLQIFQQLGPRVGLASEMQPAEEQKKAREQRFRLCAEQAIDARLVRAIESPRQLEESLTEFWFNHFNIFIGKDLDRIWTGAYVEEAIRPHVLGRFRDLLFATAQHPAMLFYLDNWQNTAPGSPGARGPFEGINENYAREVMELHTLGVDGGYTQSDVTTLAHILTGWTIGPLPQQAPPRPRMMMFPFLRAMRMAPPRVEGRGTFAFAANRHDPSDKVFLGHRIRGGGIEEGVAALEMLAASPATARHVSLKLAQFYVADEPDKRLVDAMAETFLARHGDIRAVLQTMITSAAFRDPKSFGTRFKTPYRYVVSAVRAAGIKVENFRPLEGTLNQLGERPYACLTPDGYKCTEDAWLNPDAMTRRISFAVAFAHGNLPLETPPPDAEGLPRMRPAPRAPLDADALLSTLGLSLSPQTRATVDRAPAALKAALILGSPEFMRC